MIHSLNLVICSLLLPATVLGQHVVTVSIGTCLPGLGSASLPSTGALGSSALSAEPGTVSTKPATSASVSVPTTPSSTPAGFLISFLAASNSRIRRRDVQMYPTLDGQATDACVHSPLFNVDPAGQLSVVNAGTPMTYSTSGNVTSAPFAPSSSIGTISTTWELATGTLSWKNSTFYNGTASLCTDATGMVQAYFLAPIPTDYTPLSLSQTPVSTCPDYFQVNPNGQLAPYTPSSSLLSSGLPASTGLPANQSIGSSSPESPSTSVVSSQIASSPSSAVSSTSDIISPSVGSSSSESFTTSVVTGQNISSSTPSFFSTSAVASPSTSLSSFVSSSASYTNFTSTLGNSSLIPTLSANSASFMTTPFLTMANPFASNTSTPIASTNAPVFPTFSNATSTPSSTSTFSGVTPVPGVTNSTSTSASTSASSTTGLPLGNVTTPTTAFSSSGSASLSSSVTASGVGSSLSNLTSSATGPSSSPNMSSSLSTSSSPSNSSNPSTSSPTSTFVQVTVTSIISSGSSLYTTYLGSANQTVTEQIIEPTPFTTTIFSGSTFFTTSIILPDGQDEIEVLEPATTTTTLVSGASFYTSTTVLPNGQNEVEVIAPATTTTTSYTATTTIFTTTNTGTNGQVTITVVEPTPGMQFFGFQDPQDAGKGTQPDASRFNNNASLIDTSGVFPANINFYTTTNGSYQFPGYSNLTNAVNYVVVFEGYFYGPPGNYAVTMSTETDDYSFLWTDANAYSGWTNTDAYVTESIAGGYTQNHTFALAAGQFLPMTIMWFNVFQAGGVRFFIYPPSGGLVNDTTGWFVQPYTGDGFKYRVS